VRYRTSDLKCPVSLCEFREKGGECNAPIEEKVKRYCPMFVKREK